MSQLTKTRSAANNYCNHKTQQFRAAVMSTSQLRYSEEFVIEISEFNVKRACTVLHTRQNHNTEPEFGCL